MEQVIKKVFAAHIKKGGIISSPDKLAIAVAVGVQKQRIKKPATQRIDLWCVNDELYYQTRKEALKAMDAGDSLSRVWYEWTDVEEFVCDLLNHNPVLHDEEEVISEYKKRSA